MKLAGALVCQNYESQWGTFPCLKSLSDFTAILADNSPCATWKFLSAEPDEVISLNRSGLWNDTANRTMLMYRAYLAGCEYVLPWSADVLPSLDLYHLLSTFPDFIPRLNDVDFFQCELHEIWDSPEQWRSDGVWIQKKNVFMQRNWIGDDQIRFQHPDDRLHKYPFSEAHVPRIHNLSPNYCIYHFGSMTAAQRAARVAKYAVEDAHNQFQSDYTYLADETGLQLTSVPEQDRKFFERWMKL